MSTNTLLEQPHGVTEFSDVLYGRRAVRSYKPVTIDEPRLRALLEAAVHAPTAMLEEPWQFVVVQDHALLRHLSDRAKDMAVGLSAHRGNLLKRHGAAGNGIPTPMADPDFNIFYDAGTLVVICAREANEFVAADCWLAAENFMLAARADGLGTCCIGFAVPVLNTPETKAQLGIHADVHAFVPIIVGIPRQEPRLVPRKPPIVLNWIR